MKATRQQLAVCWTCPQRAVCRKYLMDDAQCEHWPLPPGAEPGLLTLGVRAAKALVPWGLQGAPLAPEAVREERQEICHACAHWNAAGWGGLGQCLHPSCYCTKGKLALATSRCPMGKWEPVVPL